MKRLRLSCEVARVKKICNIVGAGDFFEKEIPLGENDIIIAADGGLSSLEKIGISPDFIIGDFDSLSYKPLGENVKALPCEKDITDTAAAIEEGIGLGFEYFRIFGGTGGRIDHTIANFQNLIKLIKMGYSGEIIGKTKIIRAVKDGKIEFDEVQKGIISVFSHSDRAEGVSETGLKYTLDNVTLTNYEPLGVSNEFIGKKAVIEVKKGILLIIYDR